MTPAGTRQPDVEIEIPPRPEYVGVVRHLMGAVARLGQHSPEFVENAKLAGSEACANAVEHAYGPGDETILLRAALVDGVATVTVRDRGGWREARGENRGRGIPVMREFMDDVTIDARDDGTRVDLQRAIGATA